MAEIQNIQTHTISSAEAQRPLEPVSSANTETEQALHFYHANELKNALETILSRNLTEQNNNISTAIEIKMRKPLQALSSQEIEKIIALKENKKRATSAESSKVMALAAHPNWPINYHNIENYSVWNGTIQLEDGSYWKVSNTFTAISWRNNDILIIRLDNGYFYPNYRFTIENLRTRAVIGADLTITGSDYYGNSSHWINSIDYPSGTIYLENGSFWQVADEDLYLLRTFGIGDHIIIGDSGEAYMDSIIINYSKNQYVYAFEY